MATNWYYFDTKYSSQEDANQKVLAVKQRLDNNPTDWVVVKKLGGSAESGWIIPTEALTDQEINNLSASHYYLVSAVISGDSSIGLSSVQANAKVLSHRKEYCDFYMVNTITEIKLYAPTNVDMSGYV